MSLVQSRWLVPGVAAAAALGLPVWLLQSASPEIDTPPPLVLTELAAMPVGGLEQARSMPIFSPTRAPLAPAPTPEAMAAAAAVPAPQPMPALVGLVSRARGKGIALVRSSSGQTVTIAPGQSVDGWRLIGIGRDRATFVSNGERRVASLDFRNKLPAEGAPASSAPSIPSPPATMPAGAPGRQVPPGWPEPWLANQSGPSR